MKRSDDFEEHPWLIVPVVPGRERTLRRWNIAMISALVFVVMGVFAMTITPGLGHASAGYHHVPLKVDAAPGETNSNALQGVHTRNLTPSVAEDLGVSTATHGVVVTSVDPSSAAAAAGLDAGDVIQEVDRKPVHNVDEYRQALAEAPARSVLLLVNRGGSTHFLVIQPQ